MNNIKTGLILEGGAYRGIFTTGVLKVIRKNDLSFDYIAGVSAGAGNIADFVTGNDDISKNYISLSKDKDSYGFKQLVKTGYLLNMDSMIKNLMVIDDNAAAQALMENSETDMEIVCTNCLTGRPEYMFDRRSIRRLIEIGKASCSVPIISRPVTINGVPYVDGSVTDAIPLKRALETKKCGKCVVIMTRRKGEKHTDYSKAAALIKLLYHKKYPALEKVLMHRTEQFKKQVAYLDEMERQGRVFIIYPTIPPIDRFERDQTKLQNYYIHGIDTMKARMNSLKTFLEN